MMTTAERPSNDQYPADTRMRDRHDRQPISPPRSSHDIGHAFSRTTHDGDRFARGRAQRQHRGQLHDQSPQVTQRAGTHNR
eukprot:6955268-Prymnesium_polylepis.1